MKKVAILSAVRTPIGKGIKGIFRHSRPDDLCAKVVKEAVIRAKINKNNIDDVMIGCAMPEAEQGLNMARSISLLAGLPYYTSSAIINRFCSSGLQAISNIATSIMTGSIDFGIGGGVESMSLVPMGGYKPSVNIDLLSRYPQFYSSMGITAENIAREFSINRENQDEYALESHQKAVSAMKNGFFDDEILPIKTKIYNKTNIKDVYVDTDECPRANTSMNSLKKLKSSFMHNGTVTAGNSSQISDGAAAVALCESSLVDKLNLPLLGYFKHFVTVGVPAEIMGVGPIYAIKKILKQVDLTLDDIGVIELNEAFASQAIYCINELNIIKDIVNPYGGAIALGHPLGCTGARQVVTMLGFMKRNCIKYGICTMCVGGGMGAAALIEGVG